MFPMNMIITGVKITPSNKKHAEIGIEGFPSENFHFWSDVPSSCNVSKERWYKPKLLGSVEDSVSLALGEDPVRCYALKVTMKFVQVGWHNVRQTSMRWMCAGSWFILGRAFVVVVMFAGMACSMWCE
jgi:hypothetical protein